VGANVSKNIIVPGAAAGLVLSLSLIWIAPSGELGVVLLAPWIALLAFELDVTVGLTLTCAGTVAFLLVGPGRGAVSVLFFASRLVPLAVLGVGAALLGRRVRGRDSALRALIARQAEVEQELERDALLMQALVDSALDAMCLTDRDGEILLANEPMRRLSRELGLAESGSVHERLLAIADHFTDPDAYRSAMDRLASHPDEPSSDEFQLQESGRSFVGFTAPAIGGDLLLGRVWTLREVTRERALERQKRDFVASVSHELRTPLTSIIGYTELLRASAEQTDTTASRYVSVIGRNAARLRALVDDLLLVAQFDAGRFELDLTTIEFAEVAASAYETALPEATTRGVELTFSIDSRPTVVADPLRLTQVVDNLLSNAVKFTPAGGHVEVSVSATDHTAVVTVADSGVGIPLGEQARIGERFFRSSLTSGALLPGTGLGMAIVKTIVSAHGGSLRVESAPGAGTTVTIELPRAVQEARR
jgi:signal transduction histidine kinase